MMASATVTWEIPYPQSTDEACDAYLYMQQMAERVDEILDEFDEDLESSQVVSLARVQSIPAETVSPTFEIVNFDTANLASLASQGTLTEPANTYFISGITAQYSAAGSTAGDSTSNYINATEGSIWTWIQREPGGGNNTLSSWAGLYMNEFDVNWQAGTVFSTTTTVTTTNVYYWILKIGDV